MKIVLDTNCFIDAVNPTNPRHLHLQEIFKDSKSGKFTLFISFHCLHELERKPDSARDLAKSLPLLPHFPIGAWNEQIGNWSQFAGTWEDAKRNEEIQKDLTILAKSGVDIRDRGAYIDAFLANADAFVTSDKGLAGKGPSKRIADKYGLKIMTPESFSATIFP
ncbi:MAG: PIN domain-containing protein [Nitrospira sp.]|nr:PIN domain-containing protein [Nitrospira sp.]